MNFYSMYLHRLHSKLIDIIQRGRKSGNLLGLFPSKMEIVTNIGMFYLLHLQDQEEMVVLMQMKLRML